MFNLYSYAWTCKGCKFAVTHVKVGVTSFGELAVSWKCPKCKQDIMVRIPLEEVIADVPLHPQAEWTKDDMALLQGMHIQLDPKGS